MTYWQHFPNPWLGPVLWLHDVLTVVVPLAAAAQQANAELLDDMFFNRDEDRDEIHDLRIEIEKAEQEAARMAVEHTRVYRELTDRLAEERERARRIEWDQSALTRQTEVAERARRVADRTARMWQSKHARLREMMKNVAAAYQQTKHDLHVEFEMNRRLQERLQEAWNAKKEV